MKVKSRAGKLGIAFSVAITRSVFCNLKSCLFFLASLTKDGKVIMKLVERVTMHV